LTSIKVLFCTFVYLIITCFTFTNRIIFEVLTSDWLLKGSTFSFHLLSIYPLSIRYYISYLSWKSLSGKPIYFVLCF